MICVYKIYEFIFSIIILFYYCFSGTPPVECNLLCMTLLRIYVQIPPQPEQKFQVSLSPQVPVGKKKRIQRDWKIREELMMYFCVCPTDIRVLNIFPHLSFHFSFRNYFFCISLSFLSLKSQATWAVL